MSAASAPRGKLRLQAPGQPGLALQLQRAGADHVTGAEDVCRWRTGASAAAAASRIPAATHLMHLESGRELLYNAVNAFLSGSAK